MAKSAGRQPRLSGRPYDGDDAISAIDEALIEALSRTPHSTNRALGAQLGLSEVDVAKRLRRLDEANLMRLTAILDVYKGGFAMMAHTTLEYAAGRNTEVVQQLIDHGRRWNVGSINLARDKREIEATFRVVDHADLMRLVRTRLSALTGVNRIAIETTLDVMRYRIGVAQLALQAREISVKDRIRDLERTRLPDYVDGLDRSIIAALQADGRASSRELARRYGVTEGTVRYRLKKLDESGLMKIVPVRDLRSIGLQLVLRLRLTVRPSRLSAMARRIMANPAVSYVASTTGSSNLHLVLICADEAEAERTLAWVGTLAGVEATHATVLKDVHLFDHRWQVLAA